MIDPEFWKGKRVFITGNTGFKGAWLTIWLDLLGAQVYGYGLAPPTTPSLFSLAHLDRAAPWTQGDVRDLSTLTKALEVAKADIVFHLAAQSLVRESYLDPVGTYTTNVMGTVNLLEAVRQCPTVRSVVVVTTDKCYENQEWPWGYRESEPMGGYDPYSSSKGCAELVTSAYRRSFFHPQDYGTKHRVALASARAGNVIGGGDFAKERLVPDVVRAISREEQVLIRSPYAIRPWQHVLEPLSGYLVLGQKLFEGGIEFAEAWNFGPNDSDARPVSWVVETLCRLWPGSNGFRIDSNPQPHEATYLKLDISKACSRLSWKPVWNLDITLQKIVEWNTDDTFSPLEMSQRQILSFLDSSARLRRE